MKFLLVTIILFFIAGIIIGKNIIGDVDGESEFN